MSGSSILDLHIEKVVKNGFARLERQHKTTGILVNAGELQSIAAAMSRGETVKADDRRIVAAVKRVVMNRYGRRITLRHGFGGPHFTV